MADESDAEALRKQIAFLSNLINSHKTDSDSDSVQGKAVPKNQASLKNSKKWSKWKKDVVVKNRELPVNNREKSIVTKDGIQPCSSKNINSLPSTSKFSYRRKPLQTSTTLRIGGKSENSKTALATRRRHATANITQSANNAVSTIISKQQNKYKLNRNHATTSKQLSTIENRKTILPLLTPRSTNLKVASTSKNSTNIEWPPNQRKLSRVKGNVGKEHLVNKTATVTKGAKLKWRRKSASQSKTKKSVLKKNKLNTCKSHEKTIIIPKTSKLKWRRKSLNSSCSGKKSSCGIKRQSKARLVHKSRYSIKRMDTNQARLLQKTGHVSVTLEGVQKGNFKLNNGSFLARRLKYIAKDSQSTHTSMNTGNKRTVDIHGMKYTIRSDGKTLQKIATKHKTNLSINIAPKQSRLGLRNSSKFTLNRMQPNCSTRSHPEHFTHRTLQRQNSINKYKNVRANKILRRTIQNVQASLKKDKKSKQYCMFYNKFGKCAKQKQGICPYIHDPTKIAVCTRFLRGTCQQMDGTCPFSHKMDKEKMPICQYFMRGKCTRDDCPYSHVNVGRNAQVCQDFLKGYCAQGYKCKKKHVLECEEFNTTGQCPNGKKCKLIHRKKIRERKRYFQELTTEEEEGENPAKVKKQRHSDGYLPLEDSMLNDSDKKEEPCNQQESQRGPNVSLKIRPKFTCKPE